MTRPRRYVARMAIFLAAVAAVVALLFPGLRHAFLTNAPLNGLILGVLLLGILHNIRQVLRLGREVHWIERFRGGDPDATPAAAPRLLAPMAAMLGGEHRQRLSLSPLALRSLLDGIAARLDESRDLSRYTTGLLVFLGLLGTFWGLSQTIGSVGEVIRGLGIGGDASQVFENLKHGLGAPLSGMGTAFSSSLFGLAGSLVLGFLDLQTGQAQNRFFNETEDWLSGLTRLPTGALAAAEGEHSVPVYVQALLEQTAESLETLQRTLQRGEESRIATNNHLIALSEKLSQLSDQMRTEQSLMLRLAEGQHDLRPILTKLSEGIGGVSSGIDETTRAHIRNLDVYVARLIEEMIAGREETVRQIRSDIKLLARTIAAVADEAERS